MLNDSRVNVVLAIPVERQAIDFVAEAGAAGATIRVSAPRSRCDRRLMRSGHVLGSPRRRWRY